MAKARDCILFSDLVELKNLHRPCADLRLLAVVMCYIMEVEISDEHQAWNIFRGRVGHSSFREMILGQSLTLYSPQALDRAHLCLVNSNINPQKIHTVSVAARGLFMWVYALLEAYEQLFDSRK